MTVTRAMTGRQAADSEEEEEEEEFVFSLFVYMDTVEGPRAPAVKLTAHHSSLTRARAAPLSPRWVWRATTGFSGYPPWYTLQLHVVLHL